MNALLAENPVANKVLAVSLNEAGTVTTPRRILTESEFAAAYQTGFPRTVRFLVSTGVQRDLAEELAQAAWARGWEFRAQLQHPEAVSIWVNTIAKNLVRGDFRRKKATEELEESTVVIQPDLDSPDVQKIMSLCTPIEQELLRQHYLEGWSSQEIAPRLGLTPVTVRVRLLRIKLALRSALGIELHSEEAAAA